MSEDRRNIKQKKGVPKTDRSAGAKSRQKSTGIATHRKKPQNMKQDIAIPPLTCELIQAALHGMEGVRFERLDACPHCGGTVRGYDFKKKRFASMIVDGRQQNIYVEIKRFRCEVCSRFSYAHRPFYPDTRMGLPVVDLCVCLGKEMSFNRVATTLFEMNVAIDRGTIRNYARGNFCNLRSFQMFRLDLPFSIINLGIQMIRRADDRPMTGDEAFIAMGYDPERWNGGGSQSEWDGVPGEKQGRRRAFRGPSPRD